MVVVGGFDTSKASEREHRRPQGEKRRATTQKESTPIARWGAKHTENQKRCQNRVLKQRLFYLPESGFQQPISKWWWEVDSNHRKRC